MFVQEILVLSVPVIFTTANDIPQRRIHSAGQGAVADPLAFRADIAGDLALSALIGQQGVQSPSKGLYELLLAAYQGSQAGDRSVPGPDPFVIGLFSRRSIKTMLTGALLQKIQGLFITDFGLG